MEFTEEQKQIFRFVEHGESHGIIDAVAGAGKTTTIIECAKYVSNRQSVLFCAFNNSISKEIARKFSQNGMNDVVVKTIHSLGWQILKVNNNTGHAITLKERKYDELLKDENVQLLLDPIYKKILHINNLDPENAIDDSKKFAIKNLIYRIDSRLLDINQKARSTLMKDNIDEFEQLVSHFGIFNEIEIKKQNYREELYCYFEGHRLLLSQGNELSRNTMIIDFTDMIYLPYEWKQQPVTKFLFLFIDECQDLSRAQLYVAVKYGQQGGRILAVGDPRQSIYGFTGADIESFDRIKKVTNAIQLPLTTCFRCPQKVIDMAKLIRPDISGAKTEEGIVSSILLNDVVALARPNDLIISRLRAPLVIIVFSFIDKNIRVNIHEDEVKEIINELKSIFKYEELNINIVNLPGGFERIREAVLRRWKFIIEKNSERIINSIERKVYIEDENRYLEQKLNFLQKKFEMWKNDCPTIFFLLERVKIYISATTDAVKLSTIHRAKGLENDRVFVINYDQLPYVRMEQKDWERVQEMNLKYVAITRSKSELFLIESEKQATQVAEGSLFDNLPFV
jgi:DNA helicase II / ATP-dependent DNA helicase PcrA